MNYEKIVRSVAEIRIMSAHALNTQNTPIIYKFTNFQIIHLWQKRKNNRLRTS